jgi:prepilin-type N-terminal cleavage/methylation domain-containing protein
MELKMRRDAPGPRRAHFPRLAADGFALVEVLVALLLLAFASAGAATGMTLALRAAHAARAQHQGLALFADLAESLRASAPAGRPRLVELWAGAAADRMPPAARRGLAATGEQLVAQPAAPVESWRMHLAWQDRLTRHALAMNARIDLPR